MEDDDDDRKVIVISQTEEFRDEWFSFFKRWYKTSYCWCVVGFFHNQSLTVEDLRLSPTALSSLFLLSSFRFHLSVGLSTRKQLYCCCCFAVDVRDQAGKPCLADFWRPSKTRIRFTLSPSHHRKVSLVFFWFVAFVWPPFISLVHEETFFWAPRPK